MPKEKPRSYVASRWEVWSWEEDICLERREGGEGESVREKLTIPRRLRLETGVDDFFGGRNVSNAFQKMQARCFQISCTSPAERDKFFIPKPLVALVSTSCAGIFTLDNCVAFIYVIGL